MSMQRAIPWCLALLVAAGPTGQRLWAIDSETELEKRDSKDMRTLRTQLFKGDLTAKPEDKDHVEALDIKARYVTYPYTWARYLESTNPTPGMLHKIFDDFDGDLGQLARYRDRTATATRIYCRKVIEHAGEVIAASPNKPISSINASRILVRLVEQTPNQTAESWVQETLPRLAEGNAELLASMWLGYLTGPNNDAVKFLAWKGLRYLLALPPQESPLLKRETQEAIYREAVKGIERKVAFQAGTPREEIFGHQFLRREMIRVLANNRQAVLNKDRPALTLFRVAGADLSLSPQPRLDERVEAVIGLARLRVKSAPDFQPDYTAEAILRTVYEFAVEYNKEAEREASEKLTPTALAARRTRPWKLEAGRLVDALEEMRKEMKSPYLDGAIKECIGQLAQIENPKGPVQPGQLGDWLRTNPCPVKELFKGDESTVLKPAVTQASE